MSLALEKCSHFVFSGKLQSTQLAGSILKSDVESNELGVIIDSKLSQIKHVNTRQAKTKKNILSCLAQHYVPHSIADQIKPLQVHHNANYDVWVILYPSEDTGAHALIKGKRHHHG